MKHITINTKVYTNIFIDNIRLLVTHFVDEQLYINPTSGRFKGEAEGLDPLPPLS
jgi:hypothetical protein